MLRGHVLCTCTVCVPGQSFSPVPKVVVVGGGGEGLDAIPESLG